MADLIPLRACRTIPGECDRGEEEKFVENICIAEQVERMAVSSCWKPPLDLSFCNFFLVWEMLRLNFRRSLMSACLPEQWLVIEPRKCYKSSSGKDG